LVGILDQVAESLVEDIIQVTSLVLLDCYGCISRISARTGKAD
jgi:hypothetical protein